MRFDQEWTHFKGPNNPNITGRRYVRLINNDLISVIYKIWTMEAYRKLSQLTKKSGGKGIKAKKSWEQLYIEVLETFDSTNWWWWAIFTNMISDGRNSLVSVTALCSRSYIWSGTCEATLETQLVASTKFGTWDD